MINRSAPNMNRRHTATPATRPVINDHDRFSMTFVLATIFHGIVILGVSFSFSPPADSKTPPALDIILVQTQAPDNTEDADYLAQVSQRGGGDNEKKSRPRELFSAATLSARSGLAKQTRIEQQQQQKQTEQVAMLTQADASYSVHSDKTPEKSEERDFRDKTASKNTQATRLAAEISNIIEQQASMDRTQYLNSSTKEFTAAKYMRDWVDRVERIGNLNYSDQARRNKLSGTLILDVVINADGKLVKTDLRHSSGHQVLDDAAKRIVQLAAPFPAFPKKLRAETDVIHITRSWEFLNNNALRTH